MLREIAHLIRHAPGVLALKRKLPQHELYETLIARADIAGLAAKRAALVDGLEGRIVEIGCGTGAMFPFYRGDVEVLAIEPDPAFAARAREVAPEFIDVIEASGESLPILDASADAVVVALVLCSVPSVDAVCTEIARVLRPGGELRLIEHVKSEGRVAGALMTALDPLWFKVNGQGCHMHRDPLPALARAGLVVDRVEPFQIWSAGIPAFPMRLIYAHR